MLTQIGIFGNIWPKSTFFGNFDRNEDLGKILTQIDFTEDID